MTAPCTHPNKETIPSYYDDTEWCPDCGAVRGNNGNFGPTHAWFEWQLPLTARSSYRKCSQCGGTWDPDSLGCEMCR